MTQQNNSERRTSARLVDTLSFNIGYEGYDLSAQIINISTSGLLCRVSREVPAMSKIEMALILPSRLPSGHADTVKISGVVVRNEKDERGFRTAIFFLEITPQHRRKLDTYLKRLSEGV